MLEEARASHRIKYPSVLRVKWTALWAAFRQSQKAPGDRGRQFDAFRQLNAVWLDSYAFYAAMAEDQHQRPWWEWPRGVRERQPEALAAAGDRLGEQVTFHAWLQFVAHDQWARVREAARARQVWLAGDEPFIVGQDSADTWANPRTPPLRCPAGRPRTTSATGQDWGLPY